MAARGFALASSVIVLLASSGPAAGIPDGDVGAASAAWEVASAPDAPTALRVLARRDRTVTLAWDAPLTGPAPSTYVIEGGTLPGELGTIPVDGTATGAHLRCASRPVSGAGPRRFSRARISTGPDCPTSCTAGRRRRSRRSGSGYMAQNPYDLFVAAPWPGAYQVEVRFASGWVRATARAGGTLTIGADGAVTPGLRKPGGGRWLGPT